MRTTPTPAEYVESAAGVDLSACSHRLSTATAGNVWAEAPCVMTYIIGFSVAFAGAKRS